MRSVCSTLACKAHSKVNFRGHSEEMKADLILGPTHESQDREPWILIESLLLSLGTWDSLFQILGTPRHGGTSVIPALWRLRQENEKLRCGWGRGWRASTILLKDLSSVPGFHSGHLNPTSDSTVIRRPLRVPAVSFSQAYTHTYN